MGLDMNQPSVITTDETAANVLYDNIPSDGVVGYILRIIAASDGDYAHWEKRFLVRRVGDSEPIIAGLCDLFPPILSPGASTWSVDVSTDSADVIVDVTGAAGTQVFWFLEDHGDYIPTILNERMLARVARRPAKHGE